MRQLGSVQVAPLWHRACLPWGISPLPNAFAAAVASLGSTAFERERDFGLKKLGSFCSIMLAQLRELYLRKFGAFDREPEEGILLKNYR
jgi:hypothetical protein